MDELDKLRRKKAAAAASQKVAEESCSSQDESAEKTQAKKALAITVKFGKNESEEAKAQKKTNVLLPETNLGWRAMATVDDIEKFSQNWYSFKVMGKPFLLNNFENFRVSFFMLNRIDGK